MITEAWLQLIRKELAVKGKTTDNEKENHKNKGFHARNNILKWNTSWCAKAPTNPGSVVFQVAAFILDGVRVSQLSQKLDLLNDVLPLLTKTKPDTQMVNSQ